MYTCVLCGQVTVYDDVTVGSLTTARAVCLRCYLREVGDERRLDPKYRQQFIAAAGSDG